MWRVRTLVMGLFMFMLIAQPAFASKITIVLDGKELAVGQAPVLIEGRVFVPLKSIFSQMGAEVQWNSASKIVEIQKNSTTISLPVNNKTAKINGVSYPLDAQAKIINGSTFVPLRFISQGLGANLDWNQTNLTVSINSKSNKTPKECLGFYVDHNSLASFQNNLDKVSAILPFSYGVNSDGTIQEKVVFKQGQDLAKENNKAVYAVVFENDKKILHSLLSNEQSGSNFINAAVELMEKGDYEGINLDFEGIAAEDRNNFSLLVKNLKAELGNKGYSLTLTLPAKIHDNFSWQKGYDYLSLGKSADKIIIMAYDEHYSGGDAGPIASISWVEQVVKYAVAQMDKNKIILGLGIYGYDWPEKGTGATVDLDKVNSLKAKGKALWSEKYYTPYIVYTDSAGKNHQVWYEDARSITGKIEVSKKYDLAGISLWRLGLISSPIWSAIEQNNVK